MELLIAMALAGFAALSLYAVQKYMNKEQKGMGDKIEGQTDTEIGRKIILQDLKSVDPSFSNLQLKDDNGRKFFDYYPDVPARTFGTNVSRKLTLSLGKVKEVIFVVLDTTAASVPVVIYDPMAAYALGPTPKDVNVATPLLFRSLNNLNYLTAKSPTGLDRPGFWRNGQMLMLDTPALIRSSNTGTIDMMKVPRSPIFAGVVTGAILAKSPVLDSVMDFHDPQDPYNNRTIDSADEFLRNPPSEGGGQPMIRLKALKILKYSLKPYGKLKKGKTAAENFQPARLFKQTYMNGRYSKEFGLADNVREVVFERDSICDKTVFFSIKSEY